MIWVTGNAKRSACSFKSQLDILSGPEGLDSLNCVKSSRTLDSLTCRNSGDFSMGMGESGEGRRYSSNGSEKTAFISFCFACGDNDSNSSIFVISE